MESSVQVPKSETASVWTDEKHMHFLNTMEASFVHTMLHRYGGSTSLLRLDRHIPDTADSTLDSKPRRRPNKHAPSDSMDIPRARMERRRTRRRWRSSRQQNSIAPEKGAIGDFPQSPQVVPQLENGSEGAAACVVDDDDKE